jgi:MFS family permease
MDSQSLRSVAEAMADGVIGRQEGDGRPAVGFSGSVWTRNFVLLCFANLSLLLGVQLLLPTLPLYLLKIGGTQRDVGFVMGAYTIGAMSMRAVAGWLSDRYGRKKVMISGLAMMAAVSVLYWKADHVSYVTIVRAFHGIAFGLASTAVGAIVADSLPVARMAEGIGYFGLTAPLSMGVAPIIGLWLVNRFSYTTLFVAVGAMTLLTLLLSLPVRSARVHVSPPNSSMAETLANLVEKAALLPSVVIFFLSLISSAVMYFIAIYAASLGIGNVGLFFAASSLFMVVSRPVSGQWADRGGSAAVILIGFVCLSAGMIAIDLSHSIVGFLLAGALVGSGSGFSMPTLQALAVRRVPVDRRGAATGTYYAAFDMGFGVGAITWGLVAEALGYRTMYLTTLIPLALAGAIYYRFEVRMASQRQMRDP